MPIDASPGMRRADDQPGMRDFLEFLRNVCHLLIACGCSSNRIELLTQKLGASWGYEVETLAIPTGAWITVRRGSMNLVDLTRVRNWSVDLDRLARINELVESIHDHKISVHEAFVRLDTIRNSDPPYNKFWTLLAGGIASPVMVNHYGGTPLEVALAFPLGLLAQSLNKYVFVGDDRRYLADFLTAVAVACFATGCASLFPQVDVPRLIVGGIIVLVPGLVLVNAVHEVAQKNLVSGAAKLLEAMVITASIGSGVLFVLGLVWLWR